MSIKALSLLFIVVFIAGCQANVKTTSQEKPKPEPLKAKPTVEKTITKKSDTQLDLPKKQPITAFEKITNRLIKQGQQALAEDRLLTPEEDNANLYFQAVLGRDPGNYQATMGLVDIVDKYCDWALQSARQGEYKKAQLYLANAHAVNPEDPAIEEATAHIKQIKTQREKALESQPENVEEKKTNESVVEPKPLAKDGEYYLPSDLFSLSDDEVLQKIQPIIDKVAKDKNEIDIYWPNDKEARLLYQIINSRVTEFRVRAMIYHRADYKIELEKVQN